jgi:aspartate racemase
LGLITGLGVGAGIFYYRALVEAHLALGLSPQLLMVHADVRRVMQHAAARETHVLAEYLAGLLRQLAAGGAQIATIPAFSPQVCAAELNEITPLPLIDLVDAIVVEIKRRQLNRVAVFGARVTMETGLFGRLQGVDVIPPNAQEIDFVADCYAHIVEQGSVTPHDYDRLRALAHLLIDRNRLDAILLAGTDLAFVFHPDTTDFPHVDGARIHLKAIMRELAPGC